VDLQCATRSVIASFLLAMAATTPTLAQESTLAKIKVSGSVTMGVRDSSVPQSYLLADGSSVGFTVDICRRVLSAVQSQRGLSKLDIKYQTVTSQNRIPLVRNGTVDIECGSTTNNLVRQKGVAFLLTKRAVDDAIRRMIASGEMKALWSKWFREPIPPRGIRLGSEPTEAMLKLWASPNDAPMESYSAK
jgi:ABC-type amino acid transport substrate-binding protein